MLSTPTLFNPNELEHDNLEDRADVDDADKHDDVDADVDVDVDDADKHDDADDDNDVDDGGH